MGINKNNSSRSSYKLRSHGSLSTRSYGSVATKLYGGGPTKTSVILSARYNPRSLTELAGNKIEQSIRMPRLAKPKSLVQLAAEKIEQSIKQPNQLPKPSKLIPSLKTFAAKELVKNKINY